MVDIAFGLTTLCLIVTIIIGSFLAAEVDRLNKIIKEQKEEISKLK